MGCSPSKSNRVYDSSPLAKACTVPDPPNNSTKSLPSLTDLPLIDKTLSSIAPSNAFNLSSGFFGKISPIKINQPLFHFDVLNMQFVSFDLETKEWTVNDLTKARFIEKTDNNSTVDFRRDILSRVSYFSAIAVDSKKIALIGPDHLHYNIALNCFVRKPRMSAKGVRNPCLAFTGRRLFAFSGEQKNEYVTNAEVYDMNAQTWVTLKDIPAPHGKGSACCFLSNLNIVKVLIAGGYSEKNPLSVASSELHIYDDWRKDWMTISITHPVISRFQAIPSPSVYVTEDGNIHIQQTRDGHDHYVIKFQKKKLIKTQDMKKLAENKEFHILRASKGMGEDIGFLLNVNKETKGRKSGTEYRAVVCDDGFNGWKQSYTMTRSSIAKSCIL